MVNNSKPKSFGLIVLMYLKQVMGNCTEIMTSSAFHRLMSLRYIDKGFKPSKTSNGLYTPSVQTVAW